MFNDLAYLSIILLEIHYVGTVTENNTESKLWLHIRTKHIYLTCSVI